MIRLVATDLDGTLLRDDGSVSARTSAVLAALDAAGVPVVFVTGRPLRWMAGVRQHVGAHGLAICANGAAVLDLPADRVDLERSIDPAVARAAVAAIRAALPAARFAVEWTDRFAREPDYRSRVGVPAGTDAGPAERLLERGSAIKLCVRAEGEAPDALFDAVRAAVGDRLEPTRSTADGLVELSAAGVTKASTLTVVAARFGVGPAEVVAFGDMPNDLPMLRWAGRSVAVANAHPTVLAVAAERTGSNEEDGVAAWLEAEFGLLAG